MKKLLTLTSFLFIFSAQAKDIKLMDVTTQYAYSGIVSQKFEINPELNRAWVELKISRGDSYDANDMDEHLRVKVDGLTYDAGSEAVIMESEGQLVECARMEEKGRGIFRKKLLVMTNKCQFVHKTLTVTEDDGFEVRQTKRLQVFLTVE